MVGILYILYEARSGAPGLVPKAPQREVRRALTSGGESRVEVRGWSIGLLKCIFLSSRTRQGQIYTYENQWQEYSIRGASAECARRDRV